AHDGDVYIVYAGHYVLTGELTNGSVIIDAGKADKIWVAMDGATLHCEDGAAIRVEQADKVFLTLADGTKSTVTSGARYGEEMIASGVDGTIYSRDDLTINGSGALVIDGAYKHGVVCNDDLVIAGGDITISAAQDGIHANDSVRIREAALSISAGDDGITVSNDDETAFLYVESGDIAIPACYEGLEAVDITIAGGTVDIVASDDGINANGSGDSSVIRITGGDLTITNPSGRDGDGLDSNGSIYIEGGRVFISVSDSGGNCALDYGSENGGECIVSGGTVIACGGNMMAEGFDAASPQGFLMYSTSAAAGTKISLADSSGRELLSGEIPCGFSSAVLSAPGLRVGDVCTLTIGGEREQITIDNTSSAGFVMAGMFGGGMRNGQGAAGGKNMEPPGASEGGPPANGMGELPDDSDFPGNRERPDGMQPPDDVDMPDGADMPNGGDRPDQKEFQETGGRPFGSGAGQDREDAARSPQRDWGQTSPEDSAASPDLSVEALVLVGVSVLVLLAGLLFAIKAK
ncbi:MAG: carbohydrate-binding domain-containing protein, partial [Oscillospiraceae bacterium]|nr:carbohydrate-binding domain-containing protein [Oscillospiraceae bacterium]